VPNRSFLNEDFGGSGRRIDEGWLAKYEEEAKFTSHGE
jgi:hypothetical protein